MRTSASKHRKLEEKLRDRLRKVEAERVDRQMRWRYRKVNGEAAR